MYFYLKDNKMISNTIKIRRLLIKSITKPFANINISVVLVRDVNEVHEIACKPKNINRVLHKIKKKQFKFIKEN